MGRESGGRLRFGQIVNLAVELVCADMGVNLAVGLVCADGSG